jgi:hypothetical protein
MALSLALLQRRGRDWSILAELDDESSVAAVAPALLESAERQIENARTDAERDYATVRLALLRLALAGVQNARCTR